MTYAVEPPPGGPVDWVAWSRDLAATIRSLADGDSVTVTVSEHPRPHLVRKARFFGVIPARYEDMAPWVRVRRDEDHAVCELVGSEEFGGDFFFSPDEESTLAGIGWREPGPISMEERVWNRWFPDDVTQTAYLSRADAQAAADLVTRTLRDVVYAAEA
ncbi:TY-Chap domain-containing protein [Knoellia sp. CPCC 206450]|uniref:TY-Chap domain-containing protein n=1 Tax=Knoellia tibetensis TaxID=3404798 RepID=UPI003B42D436